MQTAKNNTIYDNRRMFSKEGEFMCFISNKKFNWYLDKGLAEEIRGEPGALRILFKPKGRGHVGDKYFLEVRDNICVVCGSCKHLTKHHVVPYQYRKHMPSAISSKNSYDILVLCKDCHYRYERYAVDYKKELDKKCRVEASPENSLFVEKNNKAVKFSNTLSKYWNKIPEDRINEMILFLEDHTGKIINKDNINDILQSLLEVKEEDNKNREDNYSKLVVERHWDCLEEFVFSWRDHFINHMAPKYLSKNWDPRRPIYKSCFEES